LPEFFKAPLSGFIGLMAMAQEADTRHLPWRLCRGGKWRYKHAQGKHDDAPHGTEPHGGCPTLASRMPSITVDTASIGPHPIPFATAWLSGRG